MVDHLSGIPSLSKIEWQCYVCNGVKSVRVQTLRGLAAEGKQWRCASCARREALSSPESSPFIMCRKGARHSEEAKKRISEVRVARIADGSIQIPDKSFYTQWYIVTHPTTEEPIKVQGSYELAYTCHLMANKVEFDAHPKPLLYIDSQGVFHNYLPDFYIPEFDLYVEVKSDFTLSFPGVKEKYESIKSLGYNLLVLSNKQLKELGCLK